MGMIAAIVPAAGASRRMGRPKLTLPLGGVPVIARVIEALRDGGADQIIVVVPPAGSPGADDLAETATAAGASLVQPSAPTADMRASIELGLARIESGTAPDAVLLTPGDFPGLSRTLVARVIQAAQDRPGRLVVPIQGGRRGHPLLLPWPLALSIRDLPRNVGVNALLAERADLVVRLDVPEAGAFGDLDTPDDLRQWSEIFDR